MKFLINRKPIDGPWGGGNNFVSAICSHLKEEGHDVTGEKQLLVLIAPTLSAHSPVRYGIDQRLKIDFWPTLVT